MKIGDHVTVPSKVTGVGQDIEGVIEKIESFMGKNFVTVDYIHKSPLYGNGGCFIDNLLQLKEDNYQLSVNPFMGKKVVITGDFSAGKKNISEKLKSLGAHIENNVTKNILFVFTGNNPDLKKVIQLDKLIHNGYNISRIEEKEAWQVLCGEWDHLYKKGETQKDLNFTMEHYNRHHIEFKNGKNVISSKELYLGKGFSGDITIFSQITGNLGAFGDHIRIYPDTNICVLSNSTICKLKNGVKDETIRYIEDYYNKEKSVVFNFSFMSEQDILDFCIERCMKCGDQVTMELYKKYIKSGESTL